MKRIVLGEGYIDHAERTCCGIDRWALTLGDICYEYDGEVKNGYLNQLFDVPDMPYVKTVGETLKGKKVRLVAEIIEA